MDESKRHRTRVIHTGGHVDHLVVLPGSARRVRVLKTLIWLLVALIVVVLFVLSPSEVMRMLIDMSKGLDDLGPK